MPNILMTYNLKYVITQKNKNHSILKCPIYKIQSSRLIWIHQLVDQEKDTVDWVQMKRSIEVKRTVDYTQRSSRLKHLRYSIETPFSDIQYSFHEFFFTFPHILLYP